MKQQDSPQAISKGMSRLYISVFIVQIIFLGMWLLDIVGVWPNPFGVLALLFNGIQLLLVSKRFQGQRGAKLYIISGIFSMIAGAIFFAGTAIVFYT